VTNRANDLIADLEVQLDNYYRDGSTFKPSDWLSQQDVKPAIAQRIADYYKPLYSEVYDALNGKDAQLKEGYSHWTKPKLRAYVEFIKSIVSAAETRATIVKATRKPRKKKEKSPVQLVAKLKFKEKDETYNVVSIDPKQIIGCNQLWVFNTKYRTLAVYNAMGPAGLNVKGSTVTGWDEKTSTVKTLRKPTEQLNKLKAKEKSLQKHAETIVEDLVLSIIDAIENYGIDSETESFERDFSFVADGLRATIYRSFNIDHPLHSFIDTNVTLVKAENFEDLRLKMDQVMENMAEISADNSDDGLDKKE
jgi:hypothetical protein